VGHRPRGLHYRWRLQRALHLWAIDAPLSGGGRGRAATQGEAEAHRWYVQNVSIIFDAPCLFLHHLLSISLHFVALLCIFRN
jgi:hypothetical protein